MNQRLAALLLVASAVLAGCATPPQPPLAMKAEMLSSKARVGVAMAPLPKVDTRFPGADCLLCLAAASVANNSMTNHVQTLKADELLELKLEVAELLKGKGLEPRVIDEPIELKTLPEVDAKPGFARRDFAALKAKYGVDKLFFVDVTAVGVWRNYASYIPTAEPKATVQGAGYVIDLNTGAYDWYAPIAIFKAGAGRWDEPPAFPGLTNAYYQAIEAAKDTVTGPLAN